MGARVGRAPDMDRGLAPDAREERVMVAIAFICFAILVVAWLLAPNGEVVAEAAPAPAPVPSLKVGDALT